MTISHHTHKSLREKVFDTQKQTCQLLAAFNAAFGVGDQVPDGPLKFGHLPPRDRAAQGFESDELSLICSASSNW